MLAGTLGRYRILGQLATGGMAEILLARLSGPSSFERPVVIKRILPHLSRSETFVAMFLEEAQIAAGIRHPKVVQVHELVSENGELFLVMEYIEGESLGGIMRRLRTRNASLDPILAAHIIAEACAGLHAAHELEDRDGVKQHLVHRDVSPQNVMVTYAGEVKVLDFGIAKAASSAARTEAGQIRGKFEYMSPEQCKGEPLDRRSDVFGLGILLYELTVGARLFKRSSELLTLKAICEEPVTQPSRLKPNYPPCVEAVCLRALAMRREDRYRSAAEMRRDLVAAIRKLGDAGMHDEALGRLMRQLFADRMREKVDMLRRVHAGSPLTAVPQAESDSCVELPALPERSRRSPSALHQVALFAGAAVALLAILTLVRLTSASERLLALKPALQVLAPALARAAPARAQASRAQEIDIDVNSIPPGATIQVDGRDHGVTPARLRLAASSRNVTIHLSHAGFAPLTTQVVPDMPQRLVLHLQTLVTSPRMRRELVTATPSASARPSIFQRFD